MVTSGLSTTSLIFMLLIALLLVLRLADVKPFVMSVCGSMGARAGGAGCKYRLRKCGS